MRLQFPHYSLPVKPILMNSDSWVLQNTFTDTSLSSRLGLVSYCNAPHHYLSSGPQYSHSPKKYAASGTPSKSVLSFQEGNFGDTDNKAKLQIPMSFVLAQY